MIQEAGAKNDTRGKHLTLLQGDCLELMNDIPDKSVDLILCDLPYQMTDCKWDKLIPFNLLWQQYDRVIKDNGAVVLFAAQPFTTKLIHSNLKNFRYCWYWKKKNTTGFLNAKKMPLRQVEDIVVFYKKLPTYNPQMRKGFKPYRKKDSCVKSKVYNFKVDSRIREYEGERYPVNILEFDNVLSFSSNRLHPTQKPVALLEYFVKTYTNEGETVLDNCMGSGSTGEACLNTNRRFIGIEKDPQYFNIAKNRLEK